MDYSLPMTPFDTPPSIAYSIPMTFKKVPVVERPIIQLHDAATFEGQQLGAILAVKRALRVMNFYTPLAKVGDYVEVIRHYDVNQLEVKNLRTGITGTMNWEDLLPIPYDGKCCCLDGGCRCVYETWQVYSARRPPGSQSQKSVPVAGGQDVSGIYVSMPIQTPAPPNTPCQSDNIGIKTHPEVNDPLTIAGQTPGAILAVKHFAHNPHDFGPLLETEIGDRCRYLEACEGGWGKVRVKNLRTGKEGFLRWETFKPVNVRNKCSCIKSYCYCEYEDFEKSRAYCEAQR
ncbi:hypothetical protein SBOR_5236 [Sclerotinia borealis F-4128]|uniref:Uncharacterized protein n=1 Tax=Sclerotinia borealis (strain F-4128) TaxID=1432307 RepID=W9CCA2_SCLBF|nr:hypothetical protein SBOR_5236 [Sclerotinia borealis F-4128]